MQVMNIQPEIEADELARLMGDRKRRGLSRSLNTKVERVSERFGELLDPRFGYRVLKIVRAEHGVVSLENGVELKGRRLARAMRNAEDLVCFLATLGEELDREIASLFRNNHLSEGYIMDALGSVAVENLVEQFHRHMEDENRKKERAVTLRFSPGYCDWPVTDQVQLLSLFETEKMGVELLESCLIQPRKSVSGVFGLTPAGAPARERPYNPCHACSKTDCFARRS